MQVTMQWFMNPDGKMFRGRKSALEEIHGSGLYTKDCGFKIFVKRIKMSPLSQLLKSLKAYKSDSLVN